MKERLFIYIMPVNLKYYFLVWLYFASNQCKIDLLFIYFSWLFFLFILNIEINKYLGLTIHVFLPHVTISRQELPSPVPWEDFFVENVDNNGDTDKLIFQIVVLSWRYM